MEDALELDNPDGSVQEEPFVPERPQTTEALGMGVPEAVQAALNGELNPGYIPAYYENKKLKPKHMKILRMAVAGYDNKEIAEKLGYTMARVSIIINHQDSRAIMSRMVGRAADMLGVNERIIATAPEALEHVIMTMRTTHNDKLRSDNAFKLLDRAGFGTVQQIEINDKRPTNMAVTAVSKLAGVLAESNALRQEQYDPSRRALSPAAMKLASEPVAIVESAPTSDETAGGDTSQRKAPPDFGSQQASEAAA